MFARAESVWVVGASGQLGKAFMELLPKTEYELLPTDRDEVDVTNYEEVKIFAERNRPEIIINCAGMNGLEICEAEKEEAFRVNALGARNLSVAARSVRAVMVQISTDDVFDGKQEKPYDEFDVPAPLSVYGKSKWAGENFVKDIAQKHLVVRSSWVYGDGDNFVTKLLKQAKDEKRIEVASGQFASPTSAKELARAILHLIEAESYGTYHVTCQGFCSRYEFAKKIIELAGLDTEIVQGFTYGDTQAQLRPSYIVLDNLMLRLSDMKLPGHWTDVLEEYMKEHGYGR